MAFPHLNSLFTVWCQPGGIPTQIPEMHGSFLSQSPLQCTGTETEVWQPRLVLFSRHQPRDPQQIPPALHSPARPSVPPRPRGLLLRGVCHCLLVTAGRSSPLSRFLAPQQREMGFFPGEGGAGWHAFLTLRHLSLSLFTKTQLHFMLFPVWASVSNGN